MQVFLYVIENDHPVVLEKFVEAEWVFSVIYLVLELRIQVLQVDIGVLYNRVGALRDDHYLNLVAQLLAEHVDNLQQEGWLDRQQDLGVEVGVEEVVEGVEEAVDLNAIGELLLSYLGLEVVLNYLVLEDGGAEEEAVAVN